MKRPLVPTVLRCGGFLLLCLVGGAVSLPGQQSVLVGPGDEASTLAGENGPNAGAPERVAEAEPSLGTEDSPTLFVQAGTAYREGRYSDAVAGYLALIERGYGGSDIRYNLGNAYLRTGELAHAIAEYRKALILNPRDRDAQANLAFARQSATDDVAPPEPAPWRRALLFWHDSLGWTEKVKFALVVALVFWLLLAARIWRGRWLGSVWPAALVALVAAVLAVSALAESVFPTRVAVILPVQVEVYSGTDLRSQVILNLHAGTEVRVEQTNEEWTEFTLPDGSRGWLPTEQLVLVDSRRL